MFVGEVVLALIIVALVGWLTDVPRPKPIPKIDWVGAVLSSLGLATLVYGMLQASSWGWILDLDSPIAPFGLSLTPFVIGLGLVLLGWFSIWSEKRIERGRDPLFQPRLLEVPALRGGLQMITIQGVILMGVFFAIPLYLQVVQGLDALDTGLRMLPVSVAMFVMSFVGARLSSTVTPQKVVRFGLWVLLGSVLLLAATIKPDLEGVVFGTSMALLGVGMGLLASQLGNVIQSAVSASDRSEAGGLQYTAQQLGNAIGTALIGAIVISSLASGFLRTVADDERISDDLSTQIGIELEGSIAFIPTDDLEVALEETRLSTDEQEAIVDSYEEGQLTALRVGLMVAAGIVIAALFVVRRIPDRSFAEMAEASAQNNVAASA